MSDILLPPQKRTSVWNTVTEAAARGEFILPVCTQCKSIQYPPREICKDCLSADLHWEQIPSVGVVIANTELQASTSAFFREHLPHAVVLVKLDCGPIIFAHSADSSLECEQRVRLLNRQDIGGSGIFIAVKENDSNAEINLASAIPGLLHEQP